MIRFISVLVAGYNVFFAMPVLVGVMLMPVRFFSVGKAAPLWIPVLLFFVLMVVHSIRLIMLKENARRTQVTLSGTVFVVRLLNCLVFSFMFSSQASLHIATIIVLLIFGLSLDAGTFFAMRRKRVKAAFQRNDLLSFD